MWLTSPSSHDYCVYWFSRLWSGIGVRCGVIWSDKLMSSYVPSLTGVLVLQRMMRDCRSRGLDMAMLSVSTFQRDSWTIHDPQQRQFRHLSFYKCNSSLCGIDYQPCCFFRSVQEGLVAAVMKKSALEYLKEGLLRSLRIHLPPSHHACSFRANCLTKLSVHAIVIGTVQEEIRRVVQITRYASVTRSRQH